MNMQQRPVKDELTMSQLQTNRKSTTNLNKIEQLVNVLHNFFK